MKRGLIYPKLEEYIYACECMDEEDYEEVDSNGETWKKADEYGDRSFMWDYHI